MAADLVVLKRAVRVFCAGTASTRPSPPLPMALETSGQHVTAGSAPRVDLTDAARRRSALSSMCQRRHGFALGTRALARQARLARKVVLHSAIAALSLRAAPRCGVPVQPRPRYNYVAALSPTHMARTCCRRRQTVPARLASSTRGSGKVAGAAPRVGTDFRRAVADEMTSPHGERALGDWRAASLISAWPLHRDSRFKVTPGGAADQGSHAGPVSAAKGWAELTVCPGEQTRTARFQNHQVPRPSPPRRHCSQGQSFARAEQSRGAKS